MHFEERDIAGYRIYAGAMECGRGGFVAGVAVRRLSASPITTDLVFINDTLSGGHRFEEPTEALRHALDVGHQVVRLETGVEVVKRQATVGQEKADGAFAMVLAGSQRRATPAPAVASHA
jgi:hypothetical protein